MSEDFDKPAVTIIINFYPDNPETPMTIGGVELKYCTHPSMFPILL